MMNKTIIPYYIIAFLILLSACQHHDEQLDKARFCICQADSLLSAHQDAKAVTALIASVEYARQSDNLEQLYLSQKKLGEVLSSRGLYLQADSVYEELALLQKNHNDNSYLMATLIAQSDNLVLGNISQDKAEQKLTTVLALSKNPAINEKCYYLLSSVYRNKKQIRRTITVSREGLKLTRDKKHIECYNNMLQKCYSELNMSDSDAYFMHRTMEGSSNLISSIYVFKSADKKKNQMCIVYKDFPSLSGVTIQKEPNKAIIKVLADYNHKAHGSKVWLVLTCICLLLISAAVLFIYYIWQRHQRRNKVIDELTSQVDDLKKNSLIIDYKKTDVYKELVELAQTNFEKVDSPLDVSPTLWHQLYDTITERNPHFIEQLKVRYGITVDEDIHFCCLLHLGLTYIEIAHLYGCTKQAIYKRRDTLIRHSLLSSKQEFTEMIAQL